MLHILCRSGGFAPFFCTSLGGLRGASSDGVVQCSGGGCWGGVFVLVILLLLDGGCLCCCRRSKTVQVDKFLEGGASGSRGCADNEPRIVKHVPIKHRMTMF